MPDKKVSRFSQTFEAAVIVVKYGGLYALSSEVFVPIARIEFRMRYSSAKCTEQCGIYEIITTNYIVVSTESNNYR